MNKIWIQSTQVVLPTCLWRSRCLERACHHVTPLVSISHSLLYSFLVQARVLVDDIRISHPGSPPVALPIIWLPEEKMMYWLVIVSVNMSREAKSSLLYSFREFRDGPIQNEVCSVRFPVNVENSPQHPRVDSVKFLSETLLRCPGFTTV